MIGMFFGSKFAGRLLAGIIAGIILAIFAAESRAAVPDIADRIVGRAVRGVGPACPEDVRMEVSASWGYNPRWGGFLRGVFRFGKIPAGTYLGQVFFTSPEVGTEFTPSSVLGSSTYMDDRAIRSTGGLMETLAVWFPGATGTKALGVLVSGNGTACVFSAQIRPRPPVLEVVFPDLDGKG